MDRVVRTVCAPNCTGSCGVLAHVRDDRLVKIEPADFPDPRFRRVCLKGMANAVQRVYHPDRVKWPLRRLGARGEGRWERISWNEALDDIAGRLTAIKEEHGSRAASWISMTGNYGILAMMLSARIAGSFGGTLFSNLGIMGDLAANMGFLTTTGVHQDAHEWTDLMGSKLILLFGCNYAETALNDMHFVLDAKEAGAELVVVDPRFSRTAAKADWWIPIRPGTDAALILGMLHEIVGRSLHDERYLRDHTVAPFLVRSDTGAFVRAGESDGFAATSGASPGVASPGGAAAPTADAYVVWDEASSRPAPASHAADPALTGRYDLDLGGTQVECLTAFQALVDSLADYSPEKAAALCEVPAEDIRRLAQKYIDSQPAAVRISQGTQRYFNGHLSFRAALTLGAACGNIGKQHAGVSWAGGSLLRLIFGVPGSWLAPVPGVEPAVLPGTKLFEIIPSGDPWPIKSLWVMNYGMGTQAPERDRLLHEVLPHLDLLVVSEQVMAPLAQHADIVLPATTYYEEECDLVGSWANFYLQKRRQAIPPQWEARSDWDCLRCLADRLGFGEHWAMTAEEAVAQILDESPDSGIRDIDRRVLDEDGVVRANYPDPHIPFADGHFPTPSGRLEFYVESMREFGEEVPVFKEPLEGNRTAEAERHPLTFMTARTVYTTNSQHVILPWIREVHPEPRLDICPGDAAVRGLGDGDLAEVFNDRGTFKVKVSLTEGVKPGCVNLCQGWWPEHLPGGHYSTLLQLRPNPVQEAILETNYAVFDSLVDVRRAEG